MDLNDSTRVPAAPPAELAGPLPRKVKLYTTNGKFGLFFALLVVAWGASFAVTIGSEAIQQTRQRAILQGSSGEVIGQVTGFLWYRFEPEVVRYSFTVDGRDYFGRAREPRTAGPWGALRQSGPIHIRYFTPNPTINHPAAWEWSALIWRNEIAFMILLFAAGSAVFAGLMRERKLARKGTIAAGVVTGCKPWYREFQIEYEFCTEEGVSLKGKSGSPDQYQQGARIWILYLPQNPKRNHCYPLEYYDVAD